MSNIIWEYFIGISIKEVLKKRNINIPESLLNSIISEVIQNMKAKMISQEVR